MLIGFIALIDQSCTNGCPVGDVTFEGNGRGEESTTVTRLIPDLKFNCEGWITQFIAAGTQQPGPLGPKVQIWRVSQCGEYFRPVEDLPISGNVCEGDRQGPCSGIYCCTLQEAFRVQVQPGDFLGLELPPTSADDYEIYFTSSGPTN